MTMRRRDVSRYLPGGLVALAGAAAASSARAETPTAGTWETIRTNKTLRLGVTPSEPWYYKDAASGKWSGLGVALAEEIATSLDAKVALVETTWANAPAGLQANQFDVMFVLDPTPQRAQAIDFPFSPVLYYALGIMLQQLMPSPHWSDFDKPDMTIAVPIGTSMDRELTARLPHATLLRMPTIDQAVLQFQSGRAKALCLFHPALASYRARIGKGTIVLPAPIVHAVAGAGVRREQDKTWRDFLTTVLSFYYENGTTDRLYKQFLASRGLDPNSVPGIMKEDWEHA
jgi:polar amino acid transport system substrate-binding protein